MTLGEFSKVTPLVSNVTYIKSTTVATCKMDAYPKNNINVARINQLYANDIDHLQLV